MTYVLKAAGTNGNITGEVSFNGEVVGTVNGRDGRSVRKQAKSVAAAHKAENAVNVLLITETFTV